MNDTVKTNLAKGYKALTGLDIYGQTATTHNRDSRGEPLMSKLVRAVENGGDLTRVIAGGVTIAQILEAANELDCVRDRLARKCESISAASEDVREVRVSRLERDDGTPGAVCLTIEDWGAGARGPHRDPNTRAAVEAARTEARKLGFDLEWYGDGDGEVGRTESWILRPVLLVKGGGPCYTVGAYNPEIDAHDFEGWDGAEPSAEDWANLVREETGCKHSRLVSNGVGLTLMACSEPDGVDTRSMAACLAVLWRSGVKLAISESGE